MQGQELEQAQLAEAAEAGAAEDEVIDQPTIYGFGDEAQLASCDAVGSAGSWIGARVVMGEQDSRAPVQRRVRYDRPNGEGGVAYSALVAAQVHALTPSIQVRHQQALSSRVGLGKATREEVAGGCRSVQLERLSGTLIAHPIQL